LGCYQDISLPWHKKLVSAELLGLGWLGFEV
jgi:hypothetical protein